MSKKSATEKTYQADLSGKHCSKPFCFMGERPNGNREGAEAARL